LIFWPQAAVGVDSKGMQNIFSDAPFSDKASASFQLTTRDTVNGTSTMNLIDSKELDYVAGDNGQATLIENNTFPIAGGPISETVTSGLLQTIVLTAQSYVFFDVPANAGTGAGIATATVDPYVAIDPTFPLADEFSLVFSPYIGNEVITEPSNIDEPSGLILMSGAMVAFAVVRRRYF
jgi:hypothetical protein